MHSTQNPNRSTIRTMSSWTRPMSFRLVHADDELSYYVARRHGVAILPIRRTTCECGLPRRPDGSPGRYDVSRGRRQRCQGPARPAVDGRAGDARLSSRFCWPSASVLPARFGSPMAMSAKAGRQVGDAVGPTSSPPPESPALAEQPSPSAVQADTATRRLRNRHSGPRLPRTAPPPRRPPPPFPLPTRRNCSSRWRTISQACEAADRAAQGQRRTAQGQPGTNVTRCCQGFRRQDFRPDPAAQDIGAAAAAGRRAGVQAVAVISAPASASRSRVAASRRTLRGAAT